MTPRFFHDSAIGRLHAHFRQVLEFGQSGHAAFAEHVGSSHEQYFHNEVLSAIAPFNGLTPDQIRSLSHAFKHLLLENVVRVHKTLPIPAQHRLKPGEKQALRELFKASTRYHLAEPVPESRMAYDAHYQRLLAYKKEYLASLVRVANLPHFEDLISLVALHKGLWHLFYEDLDWKYVASDSEQSIVHNSLDLFSAIWQDVLHFRKRYHSSDFETRMKTLLREAQIAREAGERRNQKAKIFTSEKKRRKGPQ